MYKSKLKDLHLVAPDYLCKEHIITNNGILVEQNEVKYLGITFDNTLSFSTHINQITQKIKSCGNTMERQITTTQHQA